MPRGRRGIVRLGLPLAILIGLLIGARFMLSSHKTAHAVANHLQSLLGVQVRISEAQVGFVAGSTLENLEVFKAGENAEAKPWINIQEAKADVAAVDLLGGAAPSTITLKGMYCKLRFDAAGKLLTRLPSPSGSGGGSLPDLHIVDGKFILVQEGRKPFVIAGISVKVAAANGELKLQGTIADPNWGKWQATGTFNPADGALTVHLVADKVSVDQAKLESLPFIPATVWQQVKAEGLTPVDFTLKLNARASQPSEVHYRVALSPRNTRLHIAAIDLDAEHAAGKVIIEDEVVQLRDVTGKSADGEIQINGDLDFRAATSTLHFLVETHNLVLYKLPASWSVPIMDGLLTGQADLRLTIQDGKVKTGGTGHGEITNARLAGPAARTIQLKPIHLELKAEGERSRLDPAQSALETLLPAFLPSFISNRPNQ